jgi:uncharacterized protein
MLKPHHRAAWLRTAPWAVFVAWWVFLGLWPSSSAESVWAWLQGDSSLIYVIYAASTLCVVAVLTAYWPHYLELSRPHVPSWQEAACAVGAGVGVFALSIMLDEPWMRMGTPVTVLRPVDAQGQLIWSLLLTYWLASTLVVPLTEELFWRSFFMRWLQARAFQAVAPYQLGLLAVVLSSLVFMLTQPLWLAALVAAVVYAWLYIRSGKLWLAVMAHAVANGLFGGWVVVTGSWTYW